MSLIEYLAGIPLVLWVVVVYVLRPLLQGSSKKSGTGVVLPRGIEVKDHIGWSSVDNGWFNSVATTSFDIPVDSEKIFFLRAGSPIGGTLKVVQGDYITDDIHVHVVLTGRNAFIKETRVFLLGRETGGDGVGILGGSTQHQSQHNCNVDIIVTLPQTGDGKLALKTFESNLPFVQHILSLNDNVTFERLNIESEYVPIVAENVNTMYANLQTSHAPIEGSINASEGVSVSTINAPISGRFTSEKSVSLQTSNAPISGHFISSRSISLTTSNAEIDAQVDLSHDGIAEESTTLKMYTSNGPIEGTIRIASTAPGGLFVISAKTTNAPNNLKFPVISQHARLNITATTQNAPSSVVLDEAWQGEYQINVEE